MKLTNTFLEGLDRDTAKTKFKNTRVYDCVNLRFLTDTGLSSGSLENISGNAPTFDFPARMKYAGHTFIKDTLVLLLDDDVLGHHGIYAVNVSNLLNTTTRYVLGSSDLVISLDDFAFDHTNPCKVEGRYEREDIQKVYWVNPAEEGVLRYVNIIDSDFNDLSSLTIENTAAIAGFTVYQPHFKKFIGGTLPVGKIQYAYQYYALHGNETYFSPVSLPIDITLSSEFSVDSIKHIGGEVTDITSKGIELVIPKANSLFSYIRVIAIQYASINVDPTIRICYEGQYDNSVDYITIQDIGTSYGSLSLEEFRILSSHIFSAVDIKAKDNILFCGGIEESSFDVDFDSRAYRFAGASSTFSNYHYCPTTGGFPYANMTRRARIERSDGYFYMNDSIFDMTESWTLYDSNGVTTGTYVNDWTEIPENWDCINPFNNYENDSIHYSTRKDRFEFQQNGTVLGAEGPNVKVWLVTRKLFIDTYNSTTNPDYIKAGATRQLISDSLPSYGYYYNYASARNCMLYTGFQAEEIYRIAVVLIDNKGRRSFPKWICDFRMPSRMDYEDLAYNSSAVISNNWLLAIHLDPDSLPEGIVGYQIYKAKRTYADKFVKAQGLVTHTLTSTESVNPIYILPFRPKLIDSSNNADASGFSNIYDYDSDNPTVLKLISSDISFRQITSLEENWRIRPISLLEAPPDTAGVSRHEFIHSIRDPDRPPVSFYGYAIKFRGAVKPDWSSAYNFQELSISDTSLMELEAIGGATDLNSGKTYYVTGITDPYRNVCQDGWNDGDIEHWGLGCTGILFKTSSELNTADLSTDFDLFLVNIVNPTVTPYGGNTYLSRQLTEYIPCSRYIEAASSTGTQTSRSSAAVVDTTKTWAELQWDGCFVIKNSTNTGRFLGYSTGTTISFDTSVTITPTLASGDAYSICAIATGDTYINMFTNLYAICDINNNTTHEAQMVINFPCESQLNLDLRNDIDDPARAYNFNMNILIREDASALEYGNETYDQEGDLYTYNTVFSAQADGEFKITKPANWVEIPEYNHRILASNAKMDGEDTDSWLKFASNSYKDLDANCGDITALQVFGNKLFFWQTSGFGWVSVNEQHALVSSEGLPIYTGSGGILSNYQYLDDHRGVQSKHHTLSCAAGLFWIDTKTAGIYKFYDRLYDLKIEEPISSWMNSNISANHTIALGYDEKFKEVHLYSYLTGTAKVLLYDTIYGKFRGFYTSSPRVFLTKDNYLWSIYQYSTSTGYLANRGSKGVFFGLKSDSYVDLVVVSPAEEEVLFTNIGWFSEVIDEDGIDNLMETADRIRIWNDYQDTGIITLSATNLRRMMRHWNYKVPRAVYNEKGELLSAVEGIAKARIRDRYIFIRLYFNNNDNRRYILHDVTTVINHSNN